jgi:hypothetical protein
MPSGNPFTSAQAPNPMQMVAPDLAAQQTQIARQQQLADMLRQQALQPTGDTQVVNGWAVRKSPLEAVSKIAQALIGGYAQQNADEKQLALAKAMQGRMEDTFNDTGPSNGAPDRSVLALSQGAATQPNAPDDSGAMINQGGVGPTAQNAARMDAMSPGVPDPRKDATYRNLAKREYFGLEPKGTAEAYAKALYDYGSLTNDQKNARDSVIGKTFQENMATEHMTELQRLQRARALLPEGDPRIAEIDSQIQKLNYIVPHDVSPGTLALGAGNKPVAYNPVPIKGALPHFQQVDGIWTAPSVKPQAGAAGVSANMEYAEQKARQDATPELQYDPDRGITVNKKTGVATQVVDTTGKPLQGAGKPLTEFQGKSAAFSDRAQEADAILTQLHAAGPSGIGGLVASDRPGAIKGMAESVPYIGDALGGVVNTLPTVLGGPNASQQKAEQAQRNFVNAILRQESGAVISPSEFDNAKKQYFPQPGDTPEVIAQKAANRKTAINGLSRSAGPSYAPPAAPKAAPPTTNAKGWTLHTDAHGNKAYVSPDGKSYEEVK